VSRSVYKFTVEDPAGSIIKAPGLGRALMFGTQLDEWVVWCEVDLDGPMRAREFAVFGTGHPLPHEDEGWTHVNSWQHPPFVWHGYVRSAVA